MLYEDSSFDRRSQYRLLCYALIAISSNHYSHHRINAPPTSLYGDRLNPRFVDSVFDRQEAVQRSNVREKSTSELMWLCHFKSIFYFGSDKIGHLLGTTEHKGISWKSPTEIDGSGFSILQDG